jgi:hypothetical protein
MKTKLFLALAAFVLTFAACQKENDDTESGGSTDDYQPTSVGSKWQYNSTLQGAYTETAVAGDTTIEGDQYLKFDESYSNNESSRRYVNKSNSTYTSYSLIPVADTAVKLVYLKDADVGTSWTNTAVYNSIPITLTSTIVSRDGTKEVNGTNFTGVIALDYTISAPNPITGQSTTIATGQQFYAKGVGAITSTLHLSAGTQTINDSTYLVSYDIK